MAERATRQDQIDREAMPGDAAAPLERGSLALMMRHPLPMALFWGAGRHPICNPALTSLLGDDGAASSGPQAGAGWPETLAIAMARLEDAQAGEPVIIEGVYLPVMRADGREDAWFTLTLSPVSDAVDGPAPGVLMTLFETTDQVAPSEAQDRRPTRTDLERQVRERTAELKRSRDLLRATMDSSPDMIQVFEAIRDGTGEIVDFHWVLNNHTSASRFGEVRGESLLQRNPGVVVEGIFDTFKRVVETGVSDQAERHYVHEQFDGWFLQSVVRLGDGVATTTKDITEAKAAQAALLLLQDEVARARLQESEERLRQFGEASQDILWIRDAETLQWRYLTPAFETIYGLKREEMLAQNDYRTWLELILPEDRAVVGDALRRLRQGEHVTFDYRIRRASDGSIRWLRNTDFPIRDAGGRITRIGGIGRDVTDAKIAQDALEQSEERLRSAIEVGRLGLWDWNVETGDVHWSDEHFRMEGYAVDEIRPSFEAWAARVHPDDRAGSEAALAKAMASGGEYVREFRVVHPDGSVHWLHGRGRFSYDAAGKPVRMIGAMIDITDRREWEERQKVLIAELQHRTRNLLGVVHSMTAKTGEASRDLADFRARFDDRLEALARVQGLLSRLGDTDRVAFDALLSSELTAMDGAADRVTLSGPIGIRLRSSTVQTLALALHELATNAVKYGALGQPGAHLAIRWWMARPSDGDRPWLHIEWRESGVAMGPADAAPHGSGQGRELIEEALPYQLGATTRFELGADGVVCTIAIPVSASNQAGEG
ncbi:hypothetical protein GCM10011380_05850 [Sphingomonas metalli]|uniref:histidine kinase n=1 Tax=Sphingomonas metalli TaxID=1779358 RepID=A0A916SVS0_9SPHN|nr:sensor histidine kinase [Sphingomonas metalli]GGB19120.1 hypothetical protein GCM10011380_05850 [Sphingomonas metalli]